MKRVQQIKHTVKCCEQNQIYDVMELCPLFVLSILPNYDTNSIKYI